MDPIFGEVIRGIVKDCVRHRIELDQSVEDYLKSSRKLSEKQAKRSLLIELNILTWNLILTHLEKSLSRVPI